MKTKSVSYSYPSSPNAIALGFAYAGCWNVTLHKDEIDCPQALIGFKTRQEAINHAKTMSECWNKYFLQFATKEELE